LWPYILIFGLWVSLGVHTRSVFKNHMVAITGTKEKRTRQQPPQLSADEKAHKQRLAEAAALDTVTTEAWAEYHLRPHAQRGDLTYEELVHIRLSLDPRSKVAFIALMKKVRILRIESESVNGAMCEQAQRGENMYADDA
jgi:hypothetical protein